MVLLNSPLSITPTLFLLVLLFWQSIAELQLDQESCNPWLGMIGDSVREVSWIGTFGSQAIDWLKEYYRNPDVAEDDKRRILMPLEALFGRGIAEQSSQQDPTSEERLGEIKSMYWR